MDDEEMSRERQRLLTAILESEAPKKVIVAGPGTGKTYTFKQILKAVAGETLILSFLNNLVADLDRDLGNQSTVRTFHRFCRSRLHHMDVEGVTRNVDYFPGFASILDEDIGFLLDAVPEGAVDRALMNLDDSEGIATNALVIGNYYNAVGHTDAVYRVHEALRTTPAATPRYAQVFVDEYQDFSRLEASLIDLLAEANPIVIAGDDDQALYGFRHAAADYLRDIVQRDDFETFELAFCTRCTNVLVEATHRIVAAAQQRGLLDGRIDKRYICYLPEKRAASEAHPRITHARCSTERNNAPYMCRYVAQAIASVPAADIENSYEDGNPTVLVIAPRQFQGRVYDHLQAQGVPNVEIRRRTQMDINLIDAYQRLAASERSRLGWRLVLHVLRPPGWDAAVARALHENIDLVDLLSEDFREQHLSQARLVARLLAGEALGAEEMRLLVGVTGVEAGAIRLQLGLDQPEPTPALDETRPRVVITTLSGAKGLQAEHVFVVGLNNQHFPRDNRAPTEDEVCQLLVAVTRARQSCTLLSCNWFGNQQLAQSVFVGWLQPLINTVTVNAAYWNQN